MNKLLALASALLVTSAALADDPPHHWSYHGEDGPDHWGQMAGFGMCGSGKNQSPVDVRDAVASKLAPLSFDYDSQAADVFNNGHTVQVTYAPGSKLTLDSHQYELK